MTPFSRRSHGLRSLYRVVCFARHGKPPIRRAQQNSQFRSPSCFPCITKHGDGRRRRISLPPMKETLIITKGLSRPAASILDSTQRGYVTGIGLYIKDLILAVDPFLFHATHPLQRNSSSWEKILATPKLDTHW